MEFDHRGFWRGLALLAMAVSGVIMLRVVFGALTAVLT